MSKVLVWIQKILFLWSFFYYAAVLFKIDYMYFAIGSSKKMKVVHTSFHFHFMHSFAFINKGKGLE